MLNIIQIDSNVFKNALVEIYLVNLIPKQPNIAQIFIILFFFYFHSFSSNRRMKEFYPDNLHLAFL